MSKKTINWGSYAISGEVTHYFEKEPEWYWKIKPPTSGDELEIQKFLYSQRVFIDHTGKRFELTPITTEIAHREIALTFAGTNVPGVVTDDEGNFLPVLADNARIEEIEAVLRIMPQDMVMEIWGVVGEVNPKWGPTIPPKLTEPEEES
jgi:hypothetical protein